MSDPNQPTHVTVTVHGARDLYNTNFVHSMNPYCVVTMGGHEHQTQVDTRGGVTPQWHQTFRMDYAGEKMMRFKLMDRDKLTKDDFIAMANIALDPIIHGPRLLNAELELSRGEKKAGYLRVTLSFDPRSKDTSKTTDTNKGSESAAAPAPAPIVVTAPQTPTPVVVTAPQTQTPVVVTAHPPAYQPPPYSSPAPYVAASPSYATPVPVYPAPAQQPYSVPAYGAPAYGVPSPYPTSASTPYYQHASPAYYPYRPL